MTDEDFRAHARESIDRFSRRRPDPDVLEGLLANMQYVSGTFDDEGLYARLRDALGALDAGCRHAAQPRLLPLDGARSSSR